MCVAGLCLKVLCVCVCVEVCVCVKKFRVKEFGVKELGVRRGGQQGGRRTRVHKRKTRIPQKDVGRKPQNFAQPGHLWVRLVLSLRYRTCTDSAPAVPSGSAGAWCPHKLRGARHGSWHLIPKHLSLGLGFDCHRSNLSTSERSVLLTSFLTSDWLHSLSPPGSGFIALAKGIGFSSLLLLHSVASKSKYCSQNITAQTTHCLDGVLEELIIAERLL